MPKYKETFTEHETGLLLLYATNALGADDDYELMQLLTKLDPDWLQFVRDFRK